MNKLVPCNWFVPGHRGWRPHLYEGFFAHTRWGRSLREAEARAIVRAVRGQGVEGRRILEIGAGTGAYTDLLARMGAEVEVREPSPAMRAYLRTRAHRGKWEQVQIADGSLPEDLRVSSTFEVVLAVGVLNYVRELERALEAMARVLDPDGAVIVNVPTAERPVGARYRAIERLGRRRVYCRNWTEVQIAAERAGLCAEDGPKCAGVTDLYVLRPHRRTAPAGRRRSGHP